MSKVVLKPIKPSYAVGLEYRVKLRKLVKAMIDDINSYTLKHYHANSKIISSIAQDADPVAILKSLLRKRMRKWQKIFNNKSSTYSTTFVTNIDIYNRNMLKLSLENATKALTINFSVESRQILYAKKAVTEENVNLIKNIGQKYNAEITNAVMQAMSRGRDTTYLKEQLLKIAGITERRAKNIARDQLNKVSSVINNARQLDIGITKNVWHHSHAGKKPRPDHQAADGKEYDLMKGCLISGEYIYPGQLINCRCYSSPVLEF